MKVKTGRPGRPREFDIEDATRDAMEVFWQNGFHATSLPDLIEGMGLTRGSIYKAYEDKRSIYLAALDTFIDMRLERLEKILSKPDKRAALKELLRVTAKDTAGTIGQKGCFSTAATVEMVPFDSDVEDRLADYYATVEKHLVDTIDAGKKSGEITSSLPSSSVAHLLVCTIEGMSVLGKLGPTERANQKFAGVVMALLD
jgi:TetR/AcrR family transcriptional repressor of nem operon